MNVNLDQQLIAGLDAQIPTQDQGICRHCGTNIVFKPYFLDGEQPNPPIWFHPPGATTCRTKPKGWRKHRWPTAEPEVPA